MLPLPPHAEVTINLLTRAARALSFSCRSLAGASSARGLQGAMVRDVREVAVHDVTCAADELVDDWQRLWRWGLRRLGEEDTLWTFGPVRRTGTFACDSLAPPE